jgi:heptosyltransferase-2
MQIDREAIKNILAVRNDRFGEFLLNIPSLRALKETFINAKLIAVVDPYVRELAESIPFIDELIEWRRGKHTLLEKLSLINLLKRKNIDIAVMLNPSRVFNIFTYLAAIPVRVGYNRKWGFLLTHKMQDLKYEGLKHEIEYNLGLLNLIGARTEDKTLPLKIDDTIINALLRDYKIEGYDNLIALHPWTSDPIKQWPIESFSRLAKRLAKELNKKVIIIGGKEGLGKNPECFSDLGEGIINLTGQTSLSQLAGLLKKCKLLISGDSGPVHLASCVGTPVVAIFRNDIPAKSSIRWGPKSNGSIVVEKSNLSDITVEEVFFKAQGLLNK